MFFSLRTSRYRHPDGSVKREPPELPWLAKKKRRKFGRVSYTKKRTIQDRAPKIAKLPYKWLNYGLWCIYITIVFMGFINKHHVWGIPSSRASHLLNLWWSNVAMEQTLFEIIHEWMSHKNIDLQGIIFNCHVWWPEGKHQSVEISLINVYRET